MAQKSIFDFNNEKTPQKGSSLAPQNETSSDPSQNALSVSELNESIKSMLEGEFQMIWVKGEVSNFKAHTSGHFYFSLKDKKSQISSVMFRGFNSRLKFKPKDGMEVIVRGRITVYSPRGSYQILCETMEPVGQGGLQQEFEKLKLKLKSEGLFDSSRKKALPFLPFKIALVTSPTGAAVRDMIQVLTRRHPAAEIIVVPCLTQGERAAGSIIEGLKSAEQIEGVEVIITGRGGGSLEDMWCFNDEALARHISQMTIPVVSAVGHEIDFTICDFVSDLRAPTPSAGAELVCKNVDEVKERIFQSQKRLYKNLQNHLNQKIILLKQISKRLIDPRKKLSDLRLKVDDLIARAESSVLRKIDNKRKFLDSYSERLNSIQRLFKPLKEKLTFLNKRLLRAEENKVSNLQRDLKSFKERLNSVSPFEVLNRGYSIVRSKKTGKIISSSKTTKAGEAIEVQLASGSLEAEVKSKN